MTISFRGFWPDFDPMGHSAFNWIIDKFGLIVSDIDPNIVIFGSWSLTPNNGEEFVKVFFTGERMVPNLEIYDFSFSFEHMEDHRNFRFPLYLWHHEKYHSLVNREKKNWAKEKNKFCNFLYGNNDRRFPGVNIRIDFFNRLQKYKGVDSGGGTLNNIGFRVDEKIGFLKDYKFTIAFENDIQPGYTTEKLLDPFLSGSLPIYMGNPIVGLDFNKDSFICANDYPDLDSVIRRVVEIDNHDELYNHMMNSNILLNPLPEWTSKDWYISCLEKIINKANENRIKSHSNK